ncbi:MAG: GDSL-type esterase/lipase family protein [Porcipelethomonas sp.]
MASKSSRTYRYVDRSSEPVIRFRIRIVFMIFILSFAACFVIYMMSVNAGIADTAQENVMSADTESSQQATDNGEKKDEIINPVPVSDAVSQTYLNNCAFVGDSITVGLSDYQYVSSRNVIAQVGLNIDKINTEPINTGSGEKTALESLKDLKPENIYIMLGSNGIEWLSVNEMIGFYSEFVDSVKSELPDSDIYVLSIPPVTAERETDEDKPVLNSDIDKFNSSLLDMSNKKELYYVDINTALKGNDGKFPEEYAADDGMHFNKETYQIMIDYILSHTVE